MDRNTDKAIEQLADKMMKECTLDEPSNEFTNQVISQVEALSKPRTLVYEPLISKRMGRLIFIGFIAFILFLALAIKPESNGWFKVWNLDIGNINKLFTAVPRVKLSKTTFYALIMLSVMIYIEIPILKHYINRRMQP